MIIVAGQPPVDPADVDKLRAYLTRLQSTAGSVLSNATQAKKILDRIAPPG